VDLLLAHPWVSRAHARIYGDREPYRIEDLGSSNGTQLNDAPLAPNDPRALGEGDVIGIGPFRLTLEAIEGGQGAADQNSRQTIEEPATPSPQGDAATDLALLERLGRRRPTVGPAGGPPEAPPPSPAAPEGPPPAEPWVGLSREASLWLQYLPPIYAESDFLGRYLLIFEDLLGPVQQIIAHWDLFLNPDTAPEAFLPWLNDWMAHLVDEHWSPATQRELLRKASWLHQARGTAQGMITCLQIVTGCDVRIEENVDGPHTFRVILSAEGHEIDRKMVERVIDLNRPAHTTYTLLIN